ncbi:uncharacterized protein LOC114364789 [Ostrinia furnacalis]|uniref:uncharacterized protein LOC114364789 n=1 Tax=Ostrinia furnacalis TaxID=93504 RepID=UPI00103DC83A|nr:uncharacterized protein LOC114364789 [Ostrinia furnacalis]XP_028176893.1 uncharacterized protein LOC114364789 [Ostrinia furnacalis]
MDPSYYKYCIVPQCTSTSIKTPNKLFIYVPNNQQMRKKWLTLARKYNAHCLSTKSRMYFCEDHFNLPNDMLNYTEYHIMGKVSQVRMKPGCIPSKFACQEDRRKRTYSSTEQSYVLKKQRMTIIAESLKEQEESCTPSSSYNAIPHTSSDFQTIDVPETLSAQKMDKSIQAEIVYTKKEDKSIQAFITHKFRSKAIQCKIISKNQASSPLKPTTISSSTSPFKVEVIKKMCFVSNLTKVKRNILIEEEQSDSDIYIPPSAASSPSQTGNSLQVKSSSDCSEFIAEDKKLEAEKILTNTIKKIEKNPRLYLGVPSSCYFLIDLLKDEMNIPKHHLLICLNKIRLDIKFKQMTDDYGISPANLSKIFIKNIPLIAKFLRPFVVELDKDMIKKNLPMAFRHKYNNVSCIIDCLEIEVQKPSKAVNQAMTWSDYKKANTIKYLISCTPNGLVNYISPGFGGRTSDTCIVESCDFIKTLKSGMVIMADRGFKHVEQYLKKSNITLVRPPSVETGVKMTKSEAKLTKQIASLRIHVERVIRRLREFYMLKPHACVHLKFVKILDDIIVIACALINLQDSLVK